MQKTGAVGAATVLLYLVARFLGALLPGDFAEFSVQILAALLPLLLLIPLSREERGEGTVTFSPPSKRAWEHLCLLPLFLLTVMVFSFFSAMAASLFGISAPEPEGSLPILFLNYALAPAFAEEFFFRFLLLRLFAPYGKRTAVWVTAILFALVHMNLAQIPYALAGGLFLGAIAASSGSFWLPFLFHFCNNALSLLLLRADGTAALATLGFLTLSSALRLHFRSSPSKDLPERTSAAALLPDRETGKALRGFGTTLLIAPALLCLVLTFLPL